MLLAARDEGVRRVVFASSSSVYGTARRSRARSMRGRRPDLPVRGREAGRRALLRAASRSVYGLETVCLRYFNVFGRARIRRSQYAAVVPLFIAAAIAGDALTIYGDGQQSRDFTYVGNVVEANLSAASAEGVSGQILNVATGSPTSVDLLADMIGATLDRTVRKEYLPDRTGDVRDSWAGIEAARSLLGWEPRIGLAEGLRLTAEPLLEAATALAD